MSRSQTWNSKMIELKRMHKSYDDFLMSQPLTYEQRSSIVFEMARLHVMINEIEQMPLSQSRDATDDYEIKMNSKINSKNF